MNTPRILITGATGKTGTPAIKELRQQGIAVRAMASKKDERAAALTELGAEVVVASGAQAGACCGVGLLRPSRARTVAQCRATNRDG